MPKYLRLIHFFSCWKSNNRKALTRWGRNSNLNIFLPWNWVFLFSVSRRNGTLVGRANAYKKKIGKDRAFHLFCGITVRQEGQMRDDFLPAKSEWKPSRPFFLNLSKYGLTKTFVLKSKVFVQVLLFWFSRLQLTHSLLFYAQSDEQSLPVLSISAFSQFRFLTLFVIDL